MAANYKTPAEDFPAPAQKKRVFSVFFAEYTRFLSLYRVGAIAYTL